MLTVDYTKYISDNKFKEFTSSLAPDCTLPFIGVRVPDLKEIAKQIPLGYINIKYAEDVMLQNILIGSSKVTFKEKIPFLEYILPYYYSSWIMTDTLASNLKLKAQDYQEAFNYSLELTKRDEIYSIRTGIVIMLARFLKDDYIDRVLETLKRCSNKQDVYTLQMAIAWAYSMAVIKFKEKTIKELENLKNQTILKMTAQKCRDSKRIDSETKNFISNIKVNNP